MAAIFITTPLSFNCRRSSLTVRHRFSSSRWLSNTELPSRLEHLNRTCTITNTDVVLSPVETEEGIAEDLTDDDLTCPLSAIHDLNCPLSEFHDLNCPLSVVHLQSDVLETEPLNLLSQDTFVDTLLIALPVLSKEEQNILAATPAHPTGLYALYANCLAGNLVEQLWSFAWPAAIALLHQSLLPVAIIGFFSKLAVIVGGPVVGKLMDHFPRIPAYNCLSAVQAVAQLFSVGMIIHAHTHNISLKSSALLRPWFVVLVLAGAVERLSGLTLGVAVERDWVVLLAGTNRPIALAQANAVISRINLLSEIAGASLFGILLSRYTPVTCLKLAAAMMIFTLPVTAFLSWLTNKLSAGVLDRSVSSTSCRNMGIESLPHSKDMVQRGLEAIKHGWVEYLQQPVLPASLACVLLCFNVVLAPSELMTAFLTQQGLNPSIIGGFSGLCALMGVAATFVSAKLVKRLGILKAGATGLILQASLLTGALIMYWTCSLSHQTPLLFFLFMIILSRLGHMSYDIVGQQILQTGIPESKVNLIGTTELSMASLAESVMLGLAIVANDPSHFGFLATLSLVSVVAAAWLFCKWLANPTETQKSVLSAVLMTNA